MAMQNWKSHVAAAICGLGLVACAGVDPSTTTDETEEPGAKQEPPASVNATVDTKSETEILIPDTTRVLTPEARAALRSYDQETGTLVFGWDSAGIAATGDHQLADPTELRVGDVVVSEPAPAAPYGVLRRVTAVIPGDEQIEIRTDKASIADAVEQAKLNVQLPMTGSQTYTAIPGATFSVEERRPEDRAVIGVGYTASLTWTLPQGFDFYTNGRCVLTQPANVNLSAAASLGIEIIGFNVTQFGVGGAASTNSNLNLQCNQNVANHNFTIGSLVSPVYVTYIGSVPLVFQFGIAAVGGITQDSLDLTINAQLTESYQAGLGWRAGAGWGPWTAHTASTSSFSATGLGRVRVRSGPVFALSLFAGDVFTVFNWIDIGFGIGATGAVYALPFIDVTRQFDSTTGTNRGTLSVGMESGGAAGGFVDLWVGFLGWPLFSGGFSWMVSGTFPEISRVLATF